MTATSDREAVWHQVECSSYVADLPLWSELADGAAGPVLELGCGSGRVALRLAVAGHLVTALDSSPALIAELERLAGLAEVEVDARVGDAREFDLGRRFAAILAPMQLVHLLGGPAGRAAMLARVRAHLDTGGVFAAALLTSGAEAADHGNPPLPDVLERDGWIFSSLPLEVRPVAGGIEVRRLRQAVSPEGALDERTDAIRLDELDPGAFEAEAHAAGLAARERLEIAPTSDHVGSVVCVLEAAR